MTATTDQTPALTEAMVLLRHAACLERAAADPDACPRIAAYLRAEAGLARTAARIAGAPTDQETSDDH